MQVCSGNRVLGVCFSLRHTCPSRRPAVVVAAVNRHQLQHFAHLPHAIEKYLKGYLLLQAQPTVQTPNNIHLPKLRYSKLAHPMCLNQRDAVATFSLPRSSLYIAACCQCLHYACSVGDVGAASHHRAACCGCCQQSGKQALTSVGSRCEQPFCMALMWFVLR